MTSAPYRLEPRPGGYTVCVPRPCNDCDGSGRVPFVRPHRPTRYDNCGTCHGSGKVEARRDIQSVKWNTVQWFIYGDGRTTHNFASPREAAEAIVATFARPWNHEPAPRPDAEIIAAVTSFESPV
jgi:hypothetical protein